VSSPDTDAAVARESAAKPERRLAVLANPRFRNLWLAEAISQVGDGLTSLALLVVIHRLTGSTAALAAMAITNSLPQLLFGLHAGVIVDRMDRRRLMIASDLIRGAAVLSLVLVRRPEQVPWLYAIGLLQATVAVVFEPARAALLPAIVEAPSLLSANALSQTSRLVAATAGAACAGVLLALPNGSSLAFGLDALTFGISALLLVSMPAIPRPPRDTAESGAGYWSEIAGGMRFLFTDRALLGLFLIFAVAMLALGSVNVLFVPFMMDHLHASTRAVGLARVVQMLGMAAGGLVVSWIGARWKPMSLVGVGIAGFGTTVAALGVLHEPALVIALFAAFGIWSSALQAGTATVLQQRVPDSLRGRLESALDTLLVLVLMGAMGGAGLLADAIGPARVLIATGIAVLIAGTIGSAMGGSPPPAIRRT